MFYQFRNPNFDLCKHYTSFELHPLDFVDSPCAATWETSTPFWCAMKPKTVKMANPEYTLVKPVTVGTMMESLQKER